MTMMPRRAILIPLVTSISAVVAAQGQVFRTAVDAVSIPVSVTDGNRPVAGLSAADFEVTDNGAIQDVAVERVEHLPTDITFLVDVSGSVNGRALERIRQDLQEMARLAAPNDRVRIVTFARDAVDLFGLVPGGATLDFARMAPGGTTSFYDALVAVLAGTTGNGRPQMVFALTDGRDTSSFTTASHVAAVAARSGAVLCITLVRSSNPLVREGGAAGTEDPLAGERSVVDVPASSAMSAVAGGTLPVISGPTSMTLSVSRSAGPFAGGPALPALRAAAAATGGVVETDSTRTPAPELFRRMLDDFRASYLITYFLTGTERAGTHEVSVRVKGHPGYTVRARRTYGS
ncbi:MAG: VWA domain-containing protein [Vicinamibacterales bacterium]